MFKNQSKPTLNPGFQIYLYTATYDRTILIIGGGYGLTNTSCNFCVARSEQDAKDVVTASLNSQLKGEAFVKSVSVYPARKQDPNVYVSPETHPGHKEGYSL